MILRPELAARVFNTPLLMHPGKLDAGIGERIVEGGVLLQGAGDRIDHVAFAKRIARSIATPRFGYAGGYATSTRSATRERDASHTSSSMTRWGSFS